MGSSNFISAAVLDISRKATAVKERADFIGTLHSCTQNPRLSSCKLYCKCMLAVLSMSCDCGSGASHDNNNNNNNNNNFNNNITQTSDSVI